MYHENSAKCVYIKYIYIYAGKSQEVQVRPCNNRTRGTFACWPTWIPLIFIWQILVSTKTPTYLWNIPSTTSTTPFWKKPFHKLGLPGVYVQGSVGIFWKIVGKYTISPWIQTRARAPHPGTRKTRLETSFFPGRLENEFTNGMQSGNG